MARAQPVTRPELLNEALGPGGPIIVFDDVQLSFDVKVILNGVSFTLKTGHTKIFLGASGAGKSTILRLILGLLKADGGQIFVNGERVDNMSEDQMMTVRGDLGMVFQEGALFDSLTVRENVALAVEKVLKGKKSKAERSEWIDHNLALVNMTHAADRRPNEISGGMKQRVGIARALAMEPKVLLLDEPFGALDALTRAHLQDSLMDIHARLKNAVIMITHDVDEAVLLSDRIVMMTNGPSARIGEVLDVSLPRPRKRLEMAANPIYLKCRQRVLEFLYERHRYVEAA